MQRYRALLIWVGCWALAASGLVARGQDSLGDRAGPAVERNKTSPAKYLVQDQPATSGDATGRDQAAPPEAARPQWDAALVERGAASFQDNCVSCHDAQKSLAKSKSLAGWRGTVRRMANKDDASIPESEHEAIATYLASLSGEPGAGGDSGDEQATTIYGTISPLWRGGNTDIQNPGFFGDAWIGVSYQSTGPVSARATACISCHNEEGLLSRVELVEAAARVDINKLFFGDCPADCRPLVKMAVDAGRFVVPFGAFASQVNPGVYRTVTRPLIYNMGQRAKDDQIGDPVLPMPYSDEGVNLSTEVMLTEVITATVDAYMVNGLQGGNDGIDFDASRDYVDNNRAPATGGRATIGTKSFRLGGSVVGGRFGPNGPSDVDNKGLNYLIYGADAIYRFEDLVRIQFEYAQRDTDRLVEIPDVTRIRERVGGYFVEGEFLLSRTYRMSAIVRYDCQARHSLATVPESSLATGEFSVYRLTYGLNWTLPGGSLLMLNHEHWYMPQDLHDVDVLGVRWAVSF